MCFVIARAHTRTAVKSRSHYYCHMLAAGARNVLANCWLHLTATAGHDNWLARLFAVLPDRDCWLARVFSVLDRDCKS